MTQQEIFGDAKWIAASEDNIEAAPIIRKSFTAKGNEKATLSIIGLGTFVAYLNGKRISDDYFLPLNSEYEKTEFPVEEELTGFRVYVTKYDVSEYIKEGKNTLAVHIGGGWYTGVYYSIRKIYGEKKAIFSLTVGDEVVASDGSEVWYPSFVKKSDINKGEEHDYRGWSDEFLSTDYDDSSWERVKLSLPLDTEYCHTDCPADKVVRSLAVKAVYKTDEYTVYDCGENTSGYPVIISKDGYKGEIRVMFSEGLNSDGTDLDPEHVFSQELNSTVEGRVEIYPRFTWYGFRYFRVSGECECHEVKVVHSGVEVDSSFKTNDETLNWIYDAFVNTQLTNMHRGIPSDCPHVERLGYTGDGQHVCRSALMTLSAKEFYEKWIMDISDCQDKLTGRIQYTAPYFYCGGGPGGWGCAIAVVPYEYYKYYGDDTYIRALYPQMLYFLKFLDDHSDANLVTSYKTVDGKPATWCLGDWATTDRWVIPAPFVNTYFRVYTTRIVIEIARVIGRDADIPQLEADMEKCKKAIDLFYCNSFVRDYCYCANVQGANAFALNIGLGSDVTKDRFIKYYDRLGHYDTGIFGTEIVTRQLFELGRADVAYKLLISSEPQGFGKWREIGSTTLREYFGEVCRSFSHPMFGAVVALFYEYILGIRQPEGKAGYNEVTISPVNIEKLHTVSGHMTVPKGKISVSYKTEGGQRIYTVQIPDGIRATFEQGGVSKLLTAGENIIKINL